MTGRIPRLAAVLLAAVPGLAPTAAAGPAGESAPAPNAATKGRAATTWTEPLTGIVFVAVPRGCFAMGTAAPLPPAGSQIWEFVGYKGDLAADEHPRHEVCLDAYWIARHEVRRADWARLMSNAVPAEADAKRPMTGVSWDEAARFASLLTASAPGDETFRLPTEAEWERACRAGKADEASAQATFDMAWFSYPYRTLFDAAPVAELRPNDWGIFDMLGNAWEWVADGYQATGYARHALFNPEVPGPGPRVMRGGSFRSELLQVRCGKRGYYAQDASLPQIGFRLVMTRPQAARSAK